MRVRINVTKTDIKKGVRTDCEHCPVARAVLRALKPCGYKFVVVGSNDVDFGVDNPDEANRVLPAAAVKWIKAFDESVSKSQNAPFSFNINL